MLADVSAMPAWKQALLEKKRQHGEEERQKRDLEVKRLAEMPAWKRNILGKKHQQKSSMVFLCASPSKSRNNSRNSSSSNTECSPCSPTSPCVRSPASPSGIVDEVFAEPASPLSNLTNVERTIHTESADVAVAEEHISTIFKNPWFRSQGLRKKQKPRTVSSPDYIYNSEKTPSSPNADISICQKRLDLNDNYNTNDVCADTEEVTYGKGFVHKLLQKFKHLTAKEQADMFDKKRTQSSDGILSHDLQNDRLNNTRRLSATDKPDVAQPCDLSQMRAKSMDNLSLSLKLHDCQTPENDAEVSHPVENGRRASDNVANDSTSQHVAAEITADSEIDVPTQPVPTSVSDVPEASETPVEENLVNGSLQRSIVLNRCSKFENNGPVKPKRRAPLPPPSPAPMAVSLVLNTEASQSAFNYSKKEIAAPEVVTSNNTDATVVCNGVALQGDAAITTSINSATPILQKTTKPDVSLSDVFSDTSTWNVRDNKSDKTLSSQENVDAQTEPSSPHSPSSRQSFLYRTLSNCSDDGVQGSKTIVPRDVATDTKTNAPKQSRNTVPVIKEKIVQKVAKTPEPVRQNLNLHLNGNRSQSNSVVFSRGQAGLKKTTKRPASSGPGSLLIRPASNLIVGSTPTHFPKLNEYDDIKKGEFAPANKKPSYYDDEYSDDEEDDDVPVTNIDDCLDDDMPVTDIDSQIMTREGSVSDSPRHRKRSKFDFAGAGVRLGKNLLIKTHGRNVSIDFKLGKLFFIEAYFLMRVLKS